MCQDFALEDAGHLRIHCSYFKNIREIASSVHLMYSVLVKAREGVG